MIFILFLLFIKSKDCGLYQSPFYLHPYFLLVTSTLRGKHSSKQFYSTHFNTQHYPMCFMQYKITNKKKIHSTNNSSSHSNNMHLQLHLTPALFYIIQHYINNINIFITGQTSNLKLIILSDFSFNSQFSFIFFFEESQMSFIKMRHIVYHFLTR